MAYRARLRLAAQRSRRYEAWWLLTGHAVTDSGTPAVPPRRSGRVSGVAATWAARV